MLTLAKPVAYKVAVLTAPTTLTAAALTKVAFAVNAPPTLYDAAFAEPVT